MGPQVARDIGWTSRQINHHRATQVRFLQIAITGFGNIQTIAGEHERSVHVGNWFAGPTQERFVPQLDGILCAIANQRKARSRFIECRFDELNRL